MKERNILSSVNNEFIVRGVYTFQSKKYLYMVMEYMKGGDLANLLKNYYGVMNNEVVQLAVEIDRLAFKDAEKVKRF